MSNYVPRRNHIIMLDFEPVKGKEIGKYRPAIVLSSHEYNKSTGLLICCPISTSIRGGKTEVAINNIDKKSVVVSSAPQTLAWRDREAKLIAEAEEGVLENVLARLLPIMGAGGLIQEIVKHELANKEEK